MNRWRDFSLLYPNDEDMPDEWESNLADGEPRTTPSHRYRDDPTLDAVLERESLIESVDRIKALTTPEAAE